MCREIDRAGGLACDEAMIWRLDTDGNDLHKVLLICVNAYDIITITLYGMGKMMSSDSKGFNPKYDDNKAENTIYFGETKRKTDGSTFRKVELSLNESESYLSEKNMELNSEAKEFSIKEKLTLHSTRGGQQKIQCWLIESTSGKHVEGIHISRRTGKGVYGSQEITLSFEAIYALRKFMDSLFLVDTPDRIRLPITTPVRGSDTDEKRILSEQEFTQLIKANVKSTDDFYKLLSIQKMELAVEQLERIIEGDYENEVTIQHFLKDNMWMFGNDYVFIIENGKINAKNILDIVPKDFESYIDIIEVKLPKEKLFNFDESHKNFYSTSKLTKAIAQTQNYIFELERKALDTDYQNTNSCKIIRPKGIILFGSDEVLADEQKQYLRILNSSYHNLQIITYQQLLDKANNTLKTVKETKRV